MTHPFYGEDLSFIHRAGFEGLASGAAPWLIAQLERAGFTSGLVVDAGCGSGALARSLLDAGYDVLGVDTSPAMIAIARRAAPDASFAAISIHSLPLPPCVAIFAVGEVLSYIAPQDPREALPTFLVRARTALAPGGLLVFDALLASAAAPMRYRGGREGPGWKVEVEVEEDLDQALLTRRITTRRSGAWGDRVDHEIHRLRTFRETDLRHLVVTAGFDLEVIDRYGDIPVPPQRSVFVATRTSGS